MCNSNSQPDSFIPVLSPAPHTFSLSLLLFYFISKFITHDTTQSHLLTISNPGPTQQSVTHDATNSLKCPSVMLGPFRNASGLTLHNISNPAYPTRGARHMPTELVSVRTIRSCLTSAESRNLIGVGGVQAPDETHNTTYAYWIVGTFPASPMSPISTALTHSPLLISYQQQYSSNLIYYTKPVTLMP